jgi:hypothetical protein
VLLIGLKPTRELNKAMYKNNYFIDSPVHGFLITIILAAFGGEIIGINPLKPWRRRIIGTKEDWIN